jgi:putative tricarboxylic transport membrane protein
MLEGFLVALQATFAWPSPLYWMAGTLLGMLFGIIPGVSGSLAVAMMIPMTFTMDFNQALMLLLATLGGSSFGGSITAILIGVPGDSVNASTVFDGYPLAKQGRADYAIGASAAASALGSLVGLVVLVASIPFMVDILLFIGPAEIFMLTFFGLIVIALAVEGTFLASLLSGMVGLLLSLHGFVTVVGGQRFTFDLAYLWDGIPILPVFIGLFAVSGGIELMVGGSTVAKPGSISVKNLSWRGTIEGALSVFTHMRAFSIGSLVGIVIGIVPGVGGVVSNMLSYTLARQYSRNPESFGKGNIEGVIASESGNDSKDGGSLMPTLALGIPGSLNMAILLGAFVLHGIQPGRTMLTQNLDVVWVIVIALVISNVLTSVIGICFAKQLIRFTTIPVRYYAPPIICISLAGAYGVTQNMVDVWVALVFGVIGFAMTRFAYSRVALVIGLMLGRSTEESFFQAIQVSRGSYTIFVERPISLSLAILLIVFVAVFFFRSIGRTRAPQQAAVSID